VYFAHIILTERQIVMKKLLITLAALFVAAFMILVSCGNDVTEKENVLEVTTKEDTTLPSEETTGEDDTTKAPDPEADTTVEDTTAEDTTANDTTAEDTTKAPDTTKPPVNSQTPNTDSSGGGSLHGGGTHTGDGSGQSSGNSTGTSDIVPQAASTKDAFPTYVYTKGGKKLYHTYSDRAVGAEDNSTTVSYMPMVSTTVFPDPKSKDYNNPACMLDQIRPGFVCNNVIVGYDGYMFYGDTTADFIGEGFLNDTVYDRAIGVLKQRNSWAEKNGKKFYFVIAPNKNTVYPDYMPEGYKMASYRRYDQFVDMIEEAGITAVDLRDAMSKAVKANPQQNLYYKYDTHWNNHAGYIAYLETMKLIQKDFPNVVIHQKSEYQINYCETYMKDQAYYLGHYSYFKDYGPVYTLKSGKVANLVDYEPRQSWGQFQFAYECTSGPNRGFSDKLYWLRYENSYNASAPNIYVMRDSYSIAMIPFLKDSFHTSTYNWTFSFSEQEIRDAKADIILVIVAERNLKNYVNNKAVND